MKQYDKEFKLHAVQLVSESGKPASQVAREYLTPSKWLKNKNTVQFLCADQFSYINIL